MCPRCNTPLAKTRVDRPPFANAPDGEWWLLWCPGDGCAWEEYVRMNEPERWSPDGRRLDLATSPRQPC